VRVPLQARTRPAALDAAACPDCNVERVFESGDALLALTPTGLFRVAGRRGEWTPFLAESQARLADRNISAVAPDSQGRLWIGYFDRGLDILDPAARQARHFEDDVLFCVNRIVQDTARDRTAVATANGLVLFGAGVQRQILNRAAGLIASQVTDVLFRPDGAIIAATPAGVSFIEASRISSLYAFHGLVNNHVYSLGQSGNRTLAGTLGGLSVIESGTPAARFTTANSGLTANWITAVLPTSNDVFLGTYGGGILHMGAGASWVPFAGLPSSFEVNANAMAASDRAVYAGTLDRGLAVYDRASSRWHWVTRGLPSLNVTALAVQSGTLYIGTDNGLVRAPEEALLR
jgi:ligand-binding sensor domain-containing protein